MDNVVLKSISDFDVASLANASRRIKISERSQKGISKKITSFLNSISRDSVPTQDSTETKVEVKSNSVAKENVEKKVSTPHLDSIELKNAGIFSEISWLNAGKRAIRLTPKMYEQIGLNTASANVEEISGVGNLTDNVSGESTENNVTNVVEESTPEVVSEIDSSKVQESVNDAFVFTPVEVPTPPIFMTDESRKPSGVKKSSLAPAKVKKYRQKSIDELPRFTNSSLFNSVENNEVSSEVKVPEENKNIESVSREMPVVVPVREVVKDRFKIVETPSEVKTDVIQNVTDTQIPIHSDDQDVSAILKEIRSLEEQKAQSMRDMELAKQQFEESVKTLQDSEKKVEDAQKSRASALARVEEIRNTLKAGIEEDNKSVMDFKQKTEDNYKEIDKNTAQVEKTNAGTQELLTGIPVVA